MQHKPEVKVVKAITTAVTQVSSERQTISTVWMRQLLYTRYKSCFTLRIIIYFALLTCCVRTGSLTCGALLSSSRKSSSCCWAAASACVAGLAGTTGIPGTGPYAARDRWTALAGFPAANSGSAAHACYRQILSWKTHIRHTSIHCSDAQFMTQ